MSENKTLDFDIDGMTCISCSGRIERGLKAETFVTEANINYVTKRARVVVQEDTKPEDIIEAVKNIDSKFTAIWLSPEKEKTYYFSIKGMSSSKDAQAIKAKLENPLEKINSFTVNYSTGIVSVSVYDPKNNEKSTEVAKHLTEIIENAVEGRKLIATRFFPKFNEQRSFQDGAQYRRRAIINALVGVPLFLLSGFIPLPLTLAGQLIGLFIGGVTFGIMWSTGKEFYQGAWEQLKKRTSDMNTLIALGTGSAWFYSMLIVLVPGLFPLAALQYHFLAINMILGIVNLGKGLRANAEFQTKRKVQRLAQVYINLQPQHAKKLAIQYKDGMFKEVVSEDKFKEIHYLDIKEGDIIQVLKDKRVPVEGVIISDEETLVNEETMTGEPEGCSKKKGDEVFSGTLNLRNTIYIRATKDGKLGHLTRVIADVNKSSNSKPSVSKLVDRLAVVFVPMILSIAGFSALGWYFLGPAPALPWMIKSVMSVLLCACPCALGLATPISTAIGMYKQFNKKILVHDASSLEVASKVTTVVFDKTGTLTHQAVENVFVRNSLADWNAEKLIQYAASLEQSFDHPIAKSFISKHSSHNFLYCEDARKDEDGVYGKVNGSEILIGNLEHLEANKIKVPSTCIAQETLNEQNGLSSVYIAVEGECIGVVGFKHQLRKDALKTVEDLKARGIEVIMVTGDQKLPAQEIANLCGKIKFFAKAKSEDKKKIILALKNRNKVVAMVGDGVNDIEAMQAADLGIAVGSWTHASSVAKVATQQLNFIPLLIMAKETMNNIHQNLYWTGFYNLLSLTAATGVLYSISGFVLNPVVASLLMAFSSFSVVINSMRLSHKIDYALDVYDGKIQPPRTFLEKVMQYVPFQGLFEVLQSAITVRQTEENGKAAADKSASLPPQAASPKRKEGVASGRRTSPPASPVKNPKQPFAPAIKIEQVEPSRVISVPDM